MKKIFVKPNGDVEIYNPDTSRLISQEGEWVPNNPYWHNRIREGAVKLRKQTVMSEDEIENVLKKQNEDQNKKDKKGNKK